MASAAAALSAAAVALISFQSATAQSAAEVDLGRKEHVIEIQKFRFVPDILRVRANDTITWVNRDVVPHTATAKDESWDTGGIKRDKSMSVVVTPETTIAYFCRFHVGMKAMLEITVED